MASAGQQGLRLQVGNVQKAAVRVLFADGLKLAGLGPSEDDVEVGDAGC